MIYFRTSFCYTVEVLDIKFWANFFVSIGIAEFHDFLSFQFILKLSYSQPFHNTLNYGSNTNIEEVMKFYDLSDKQFETHFSQNGSECVIRLVSLPHSVACNRDKSIMLQRNKIEALMSSGT